MLPLPEPNLNGYSLTHAELRAVHKEMRATIRSATAERALDGPRLLSVARGEKYVLSSQGRDRDGSLLVTITVHMPWQGAPYVRRIRLIKEQRLTRGQRLG